MNKVLVTGANGFLGANLSGALFRNGYTLRALVRPGADLSALAGIPCEIVYGRIHNKADVYRAVAGCRYVVHAAAITDQWGIPFEEYERVNFQGTKNIAEACLEHKVSRLVYVSTANTLGPGTRENPGTELNCFTHVHADSGYIQTKYLAQQYVLEQIEQKKLPAVVVNPTFMIGPQDRKPSSGKLLLYALQHKVLFCPPGGKNFVHIADVCTGIINALERGQIGDVYLLAGHNLSYREFFGLVGRIARKPKFIISIPGFVLKLLGALGSASEQVVRRQSRLNYTTAYLLCLQNYYSGRKSEDELAVTYTSMEEAVNHALTWFKEQNYCQ